MDLSHIPILRKRGPKSIAQLIFLLLLVASHSSSGFNCEQLSTVFVLETSDSFSDSAVGPSSEASAQKLIANHKSLVSESPNTRIITDEDSSNNNNNHHHQATSKQTHEPSINTDHHHQQHQLVSNKQTHDQHNHNPESNVQSHNIKKNASTSATSNNNNPTIKITTDATSTQQSLSSVNNNGLRPSDEETRSLAAQTRLKVGSQPITRNTSQQSNVNNQQQVKSTPSYDVSATTSTPKSEERLLISITNDDDNSGNDEQQPPLSQIPKRKPSITISIQDGNLNKQNGGAGSALIVNGQSIVISTIGVSGLENQGNINQHSNMNKPNIIPIINGNNNNNRPPYREPTEIAGPINSQIHHHTTSTTYRPQLPINNNNDDYNPSSSFNNQRPITSTLVEPPRQPMLVTDERPQRPVVVAVDDLNSFTNDQKRPTSRPIVNRPPTPQQPSANIEPASSSIQSNDQINEDKYVESKYPLNEKNCGLVHETRIVGGEEADPGDFLWMAAIVKSKPSIGEVRPFCGGSLITRRHILTAAHCLENLAPRDVLVRLGSYDFDDATASSLSADYAIDQFRVPAQYSKKTHVADLAIMRLKTPLSLNDNYKTVCMPQQRRSYVGALGTVTGYGSQSQTFRRAAPKLRQVTVPIWENRKCSAVYKKNLTESFLCAGYEEGGKDACQGDSGGPIMTDGPNERMMIVGVVSHGIGCGAPGYPGVYTRTSTFLDWIEKNTKE